jgi:hypothetical protein
MTVSTPAQGASARPQPLQSAIQSPTSPISRLKFSQGRLPRRWCSVRPRRCCLRTPLGSLRRHPCAVMTGIEHLAEQLQHLVAIRRSAAEPYTRATASAPRSGGPRSLFNDAARATAAGTQPPAAFQRRAAAKRNDLAGARAPSRRAQGNCQRADAVSQRAPRPLLRVFCG